MFATSAAEEVPTVVGSNDNVEGAAVIVGGGGVYVREMLSTAAGGCVPNDPSFCHVNIRRTVVPARVFGNVIVCVENVVKKVVCVYTSVAPASAVLFDAGVPAAGVTDVSAV
jgi:hypothetical protein